MKIKIFLSILLSSGLIISACTDELIMASIPQNLFAVWVYDRNEEDITVLKKAAQLDSDKYGFIIYADGKFLERKNAGWCGTPPVYYSNFHGNWNLETDSLLKINVGYWGGTTKYNIQIISLGEKELKIKYQN